MIEAGWPSRSPDSGGKDQPCGERIALTNLVWSSARACSGSRRSASTSWQMPPPRGKYHSCAWRCMKNEYKLATSAIEVHRSNTLNTPVWEPHWRLRPRGDLAEPLAYLTSHGSGADATGGSTKKSTLQQHYGAMSWRVSLQDGIAAPLLRRMCSAAIRASCSRNLSIRFRGAGGCHVAGLSLEPWRSTSGFPRLAPVCQRRKFAATSEPATAVRNRRRSLAARSVLIGWRPELGSMGTLRRCARRDAGCMDADAGAAPRRLDAASVPERRRVRVREPGLATLR